MIARRLQRLDDPREASAARASLPFAEKHGGWVLAICLHVMAFAALASWQEPARSLFKQEPPRRAIVVHLESPDPAPSRFAALATGDPNRSRPAKPAGAMAAVVAPDAGEQAKPAQATLVPDDRPAAQGVAEAKAADAKPARRVAARPPKEAPAPPKIATDAKGQDRTPASQAERATRDETAALSALERRYPGILEQLDRDGKATQGNGQGQADQGSVAVQRRLGAAQADLVAKRTLYRAPTLSAGVDRSIDLSDIDLNKAQTVLGRYGIKIMVFQADRDMPEARFNNRGYLNSAVTRTGVFTQSDYIRRGNYQMFTFGAIAEKRMAQLEEEALAQKKLDPARTRVTRVVFGVVPTMGGLDLGIRSIEFERLNDANPNSNSNRQDAKDAMK
jgi:hypothetical protein